MARSNRKAIAKTPRGRRNAAIRDNSPRIGAPYFAHDTLDPAIYPLCEFLFGTIIELFKIWSLDTARHVVYDSSELAERHSFLRIEMLSQHTLDVKHLLNVWF